jgi:hypothetical protein
MHGTVGANTIEQKKASGILLPDAKAISAILVIDHLFSVWFYNTSVRVDSFPCLSRATSTSFDPFTCGLTTVVV